MFSLAAAELRPLTENDLRQVLLWRNSGQIRKNMFTSRLISWEEHVAWFNCLQYRTDQAVLLFVYQGEGRGVINFTKIDKINCCCEWGFYIGVEDAEPGSGTAMGLLGLDYALLKSGMTAVYGQCLTTNLASIRYHEKLGFVFRGQQAAQPGADGQAKIPAVKLFELCKETWVEKRKILYPRIFVDYEKAMGESDVE